MRVITVVLSAASIVALLAACAAVPSGDAETSTDEVVRPSSPADLEQLACVVWNCTDLHCMNLETGEITPQAYTACAAVLADAQHVGVSICEGRKGMSVVSSPGSCTPMGMRCPNVKRGGYEWDQESSGPVEPAPADGGVDEGSPATGDATPDAAGNGQ
jgi:hypothetical protein